MRSNLIFSQQFVGFFLAMMQEQQQQQSRNPVVATLANPSQHPYSSIALSPDRSHAVVAGKDNLQLLSVSPHGLSEIRNVRIAHRFLHTAPTTTTTTTTTLPTKRYGDIRDTFNLRAAGPAQTMMPNASAVVTDVAWSAMQSDGSQVIAAAGSNGLIVVWDALDLMTGVNPAIGPQPEAVLSQHSMPVNRLAWHPSSNKAGLLLSASQDETVKLWVRHISESPRQQKETPRSWFSLPSQETPLVARRSYSWQCITTFEPRAAVRDIQWSPFQDDVFAMVTQTGSLLIYKINVPGTPWVRILAHANEATTVDWHPTLPFIIATGGGDDRTVKIWDLESKMNLDVPIKQSNLATNANSARSEQSMSAESTYEESTPPATVGRYGSSNTWGYSGSMGGSTSVGTVSQFGKVRPRSTNLSISAPVTKVMWRPPAGHHVDEDIHASMLAVATAPIRGTSAGGNGLLSLWSYHRPFMPLSVVEGHINGAVADFVWLDTPQNEFMKRKQDESPSIETQHSANEDSRLFYMQTEGTWQHVLSVGRDSHCVIQSLVRGMRPISRVSPSCFAMANLSPFQRGYGSLQIFSVHQKVPSGPLDDFLLTGLRLDTATACAPGIFREVPSTSSRPLETSSFFVANQKLPVSTPTLTFNVIDKGDLDDESNPAVNQASLIIAPEVVHLSRFANSYKLYVDETLTTRVQLCTHNASVAQRLQMHSLAQMWRTVASILKGAGMDMLPPRGSQLKNAFQFALLPTMKSLLEERADAGDVQTCVALCEILQVIEKADAESQETRIPGLELNLVREWYLSYIDLLQQMCLFSHATFLIRGCNDPMIRALNQQSTVIHESCPHCGKPMQGSEFDPVDSTGAPAIVARRACHSCRRRVGMCFLCHEPVTGVFVWCPGCGHGGHLDHALEWFGGSIGSPVREVCPTGCGHKCNLKRQLNSFPRTESFYKCMEVGGGD